MEAPASARANEQRQVRDAYGIALVALFASVILLIAWPTPVPSSLTLIEVLLQITALALTMRVSGMSRRLFIVSVAIITMVFAGGIGAAWLGGGAADRIALAGWLFLVLATIVGIVRRLATYRTVNLPLVLGLLCVYLLLGMSFGLVYAFADAGDVPAFTQGFQRVSEAVYFSFITLATVGYGDFTPAVPVVRAVAVAEAITGQLYLVGIVSLAVSRLGEGRTRVRDSEDTPAE